MQATSHEEALASALTVGGQAGTALRDQQSALHLAEQARKAAEKRAVRCASQLTHSSKSQIAGFDMTL